MKIIYFLFICIFISQLKADLPVHCLARNIQGEWSLYVYTNSSGLTLNIESCGHENPDKNTDHINFDFKALFKDV